MHCPICDHDGVRMLLSRLLANGSRYRRFSCNQCNHRWSTWTNERPQQGRTPMLTDEQLREVLTQLHISDEVMAGRMGRTRESIRQIRTGITLAKRCPDLPRRTKFVDGLTCATCRHWRGQCGFDLPDPVEEGIGFAQDCALYET